MKISNLHYYFVVQPTSSIELVTAKMGRYFKMETSNEKYTVSMEIVNAIYHTYRGRFLKQGIRCWVPVDTSEARTKVAQAIQYLRRKQIANTDNSFPSRQASTTGSNVSNPPEWTDLRRPKQPHTNESISKDTEKTKWKRKMPLVAKNPSIHSPITTYRNKETESSTEA